MAKKRDLREQNERLMKLLAANHIKVEETEDVEEPEVEAADAGAEVVEDKDKTAELPVEEIAEKAEKDSVVEPGAKPEKKPAKQRPEQRPNRPQQKPSQKPQQQPKQQQRQQPKEAAPAQPVDLPNEATPKTAAVVAGSEAKPAAVIAGLEAKPMKDAGNREKTAEAAKFTESLSQYHQNGVGKAYKFWSRKSQRWLITQDYWVARQFGGDHWAVVWVWYRDGQIHHLLDEDEADKYLP